ncbi:MAG: hypothetical protein IKJ76_02340 [Fibrobacter sp.]|nr:hypothetical protein [Fibrobacter sp.]
MLNLNYRCKKQLFRQAAPPAPKRNYEKGSGSLKDALAETLAGLDGWTQVKGNGNVMLVDKYVDTIDKDMSEFKKAAKKKL